jgi:hypothetical protein
MSDLHFQLEKEYNTLNRLRERMSEFRDDLESRQNENTIYYAVDFSELHPYLHLGQEEEDNIIGVSLEDHDNEKKFNQYWLALTHLFNTFSNTLYLLPPHTLELWNYARTQAHKGQKSDSQYNRLLERTRKLSPEHKELLQSLQNVDRIGEVSRELLEFVKSPEFRPLCVDVSEFVTWHKRGTALKRLFESQKVSNRIDRILLENGRNYMQLKHPTGHETLEVLQRFSRAKVEARRNQTLIDSRALVFLRNVNSILADSRARLVLITRDLTILHAAKILAREPWFKWPEARQHVRGLEGIFLDLILQGMSNPAKLNWTRDSELKLNRIQESVQRILAQVKRSQHAEPEKHLASLGKKVLTDAAHLWDQNINVRLSLALRYVPWLGESFLDASPEGRVPLEFRSLKSEYNQLKYLLEFLTSPIYQDLAVKDVQSFWRALEIDSLRMGFIDLLGKETAKRVSKLLTEAFSDAEAIGVVVRSTRFLKMPSVIFVSEQYQSLLKPFQVPKRVNYDKAFLAVVYEAVSGLNEPEDFLFMAFVLGMVDQWDEALKVIEKCREISLEINPRHLEKVIMPSEIDYFEGIVRRRIAATEDDSHKAIQGFTDALKLIERAIEIRAQEPRYLKEKAATILLYHEATNRYDVNSTASNSTVQSDVIEMPSVEEAKEFYKSALRILERKEDQRLRIRILNDLAYAEVLSESPSFEEAGSYLRELEELLETGGDEQLSRDAAGLVAYIADTKIMLRARQAKENRDIHGLNEASKELEIMLTEDLSEPAKALLKSHIEILSVWYRQIA